MKKSILIFILTLFIISISTAQNESIKSLVEKTSEKNLDIFELTEIAKNQIKDKRELAEFFYYWIGSNIKYDYEFYKKIKEGKISSQDYNIRQHHYEVFDSKTAVCGGYANLFEWFMFEIDVEVEIITGHIRDQRNHYVDLSSKNYLHAWNAIKLDDNWLLVDSTWGVSNDSAQSDFYFDINPEWAILTHYPSDQTWQLLEKPLSLEEFNESKFVNQLWFFAGFTDIPKLMEDQDYYYFIFTTNPDENWLVSLYYSSDNMSFNPIKDILPINQDGSTYYRFSKKPIQKKAYFKVNLIHLNSGEDYSYSLHKDIINFKI